MSASSRIAVACGLTEEEAAQLAAGVPVAVLTKIEAGIAGKVAGPWWCGNDNWHARVTLQQKGLAVYVYPAGSSCWSWRSLLLDCAYTLTTLEAAKAAADAALLADGWVLL